MARKKRRRLVQIVPRLGPATNLRPAGAHESRKLYDRKREKAALRREAEGGFSFSALASPSAPMGTILASEGETWTTLR